MTLRLRFVILTGVLFCVAAHHVSLALAALGLTGDARRKVYGQLRKLLKNSRYDEVVSELRKIGPSVRS